MTYDEKYEFLRGYLYAWRRQKRLEEEISKARLNEMFPSVNADGMPHGHKKRDLSDYAAEMDEYLTEHTKAVHACEIKRKEVITAIESLNCKDADKYKEVMLYRFTHIKDNKLMRYEDISATIKTYSPHHVKRLCIAGIKALDL